MHEPDLLRRAADVDRILKRHQPQGLDDIRLVIKLKTAKRSAYGAAEVIYTADGVIE
jgi:hypothetical protein